MSFHHYPHCLTLQIKTTVTTKSEHSTQTIKQPIMIYLLLKHALRSPEKKKHDVGQAEGYKEQ